LLNYRCEHVF